VFIEVGLLHFGIHNLPDVFAAIFADSNKTLLFVFADLYCTPAYELHLQTEATGLRLT
jgi:hypothetical protein